MSLFDESLNRQQLKRSDRLKSVKEKAEIEAQKYPYAIYQGKDPIDGTDIVKTGANEPVSGFRLISNAPVDIGGRVALRENNQGGLQRVDDLNRRRIAEQQPISQTFTVIYLLRELDTNSLYVSDGVQTEEIAAFDVLSTEVSTGITGTITKTGTEFSDWIVTGLYRKNESDSSVTENRLVSFYLTPFEELEEEVKYLSEDVVNNLIFEQHLEDPLLSDTDLILSSQFRVGETVYSSTDNFATPITVTTTNEARGALTTRFVSGVDIGYGWIISNDRLKNGSDELDGGGKRGAFLYRGVETTYPSTAPDNDTTGEMRTGGYYRFGTYEGNPAFILRSLLGVDFESGLPAKIRFFRDVLADSVDELIDLSTETIQNDVYDLTPLGTTPISGGFLSAYTLTLDGDEITSLPYPTQETIALFLIDGDEFTYTDVYFNQKENFVRRKMYEFTMTGDHDADVWLNPERMITQKVGYRYIQGYKTPTEEDPDSFVRSGFKHFRAIATDIRQGFEYETQLFRRTLDTVGTLDNGSLETDAFYIDNSGDQNLVEQTDYFDEEPEVRVLSIPLNGNLINNELVFLVLDILDGTINQLQKTIDLSSLPLEEIEEAERIVRIDDQLYSILSQSAWLAG